jgi:hypothetical protein
MKRFLIVNVFCLLGNMAILGSGIEYNGTKLSLNTEFSRSEIGETNKNDITEVSGMACSRVTPGYFWVQNDEGVENILALNQNGNKAMTLTLNGTTNRDDWEDLCVGEYNGKQYLFLGAFGDNDLVKENYIIYYFLEPEIKGSSASVNVKNITFGFPDNKAHNIETLMYDPIEEMFYIVDKVKNGVCTAYSLKFKTDYVGTQKLTEICTMGQEGEDFDFITAGDISQDGHWIIVKNKKYALLWERQGNESISETLKRQPMQIDAYEEEEQGEAVAWLDNTTFFTTSDSKSNTPIFKYVRKLSSIEMAENTNELGLTADCLVFDLSGQYICNANGLQSKHGVFIVCSKDLKQKSKIFLP